MTDSVAGRIRSYQTELFAALEEFFLSVTRGRPDDFVSEKVFATVDSWAPFANRFNAGMRVLQNRLEGIYLGAKQQFADAGNLGGTKLVLGGGSRFYGTQFRAVQSAAVYADTVLLPDPVYAWIEAERDDARSIPLEVFKTIRWLLKLKPLIDVKTEVLPVVIFPSFEKSLENTDAFTQEGMKGLVTNYLNAGLGTRFSSVEEALEFARGRGDLFLRDVEQAGLYVPSGHDGPTNSRFALQQYRELHLASRSVQHVEAAAHLTDAELLFTAIFESVAPQFHLYENASTFAAQPLMAFRSHWHYFKTLSAGSHGDLVGAGFLSKRTLATMEALQRERFAWLSNISTDEVVELRKSAEHLAFRQALDKHLAALSDVELDNVDRVACEIASSLSALLDRHDVEGQKLSREFASKHNRTAALVGTAVAATFFPAIAAVVSGAAPFALLTKYLYDKLDERARKRTLSTSFMGVLADLRNR